MILLALGELIEESRKITGRRVQNVEGIPKMETSFLMEGNYKGTSCTDVGTYAAVLREGVLHGEGQGIVMTKDGQGMASWTGQGIGRFTGAGKVVSEERYTPGYLQSLREENCPISITW